jgi:YbbR domain-containing protein
MNTKSRFLNNLFSFLISFTLAVVVWLVATQGQDPIITDTVSMPVPIEYTKQPSGTVVVGDLKQKITALKLRAPRSSWEGLDVSKFRAVVDISNLEVGLSDVPVRVECSDPNVKVLEVVPKSVTVRIERLVEKKVPVKVHLSADVPFGYELSKTEFSPQEVVVKGPQSMVDKVESAETTIAFGTIKESMSRKAQLRPMNKEGKQLTGPELTPPTVTITVTVKQLAGVRELPVVTQITGQPAPGYRVSGVSVSPQEVKVLGSPEEISKLPGYVETPPIDVSKATSTIQRTVPLSLPKDVTVWGPLNVTVSVEISPIEGSMSLQLSPTAIGLGPGLEAQPSPDKVTVILSGPLPKINSLKPEDVRVELNLTGKGVGRYKVEPRVVPPAGINVDSVLPNIIEVAVTKVTTPTATITPTISPTATTTTKK